MPVNIIDTLKPKNGGSFPIAEAADIAVAAEKRLPEALADKADLTALNATNIVVATKANASDVATATNNLQGQIDQIVISASAEAVVAPEVAQARVGADSTEYNTLKNRIDAEITKLHNKDSESEKLTGAALPLDSLNNMFDGVNMFEKTEIQGDGTTRESSVYYVTDYIPVDENTVYYVNDLGYVEVNTSGVTEGVRLIAFYDENNALITGAERVARVIAPNGALFARVMLAYNSKNVHGFIYMSNGADMQLLSTKAYADDRARLAWEAQSKSDFNNLLAGVKTFYGQIINPGSPTVAAINLNYTITDFIPVDAGDKYYVFDEGYYKTITDAIPGARAIFFYNSNKEYMSYVEKVSDFVVPENVAYIRIDLKNISQKSGHGMCWLSKTKLVFNINYNQVPFLDAIDNTNLASSDIGHMGYYVKDDFEEMGTGTNYSAYGPIDVSESEGETLYAAAKSNMSAAAGANATRFISFFDSEGENIFYVQQAKSAVIPEGAVTAWVTFPTTDYGTMAIDAEAYIYIGEFGFKAPELVLTDEQLLNSEVIQNIKNASGSKSDWLKEERRIAVVNFQFDDCPSNDANAVEIFKEYGARCGFAFIASEENIMSLAQTYRGYQDEGFEIISHSTDGTPMADASESFIRSNMKLAKQRLVAAGFNVRGWVTPSSVLNPLYRDVTNEFYDWGSNVLYGAYDPTVQCYFDKTAQLNQLSRVSVQNSTLAEQKQAVDDAIANKGFLSFYGHMHSIDSGNYFTTEGLKELLAYINEKAAEQQIYILTPSDAIDYYFHVRHSDYLELLNSQI